MHEALVKTILSKLAQIPALIGANSAAGTVRRLSATQSPSPSSVLLGSSGICSSTLTCDGVCVCVCVHEDVWLYGWLDERVSESSVSIVGTHTPDFSWVQRR